MRRRKRYGAGAGARTLVQAGRREVLGLYSTPLLIFSVVWLVAAVGVFLLLPTEFGRGLWVGVTLAVLVGMPLYVLAFNGLLQRAMGGDAEEWTGERLAELDARRWWSIHDLYFDRMNVDHVLVGSKQVFVIETKWCSWATRIDQRLPHALRQAKRGAQKVGSLLRSYGVRRPVTPVVILWGPKHRIDGRTMVERDGVLVAVGAGVDELLEELGRRCGSYDLDLEPRRALEAFAANQAGWRESAGV